MVNKQHQTIAMNQIKPYIHKKSPVNGFNFNYYLHIKGGSGNYSNRVGTQRYGGEHDFILFYASPGEMHGCNICERKWCEEKGIIYGEGSSIEEAYEDYIKKAATNKPL